MVEGESKRGRPSKRWLDNISEWTKMDINDLVNVVHDQIGKKYFKVKCVNSPYDFRVTGLKVSK